MAPGETTDKAAGNGTVLVVDDEDSVRRVLNRILQRHGFDVVEATNGLEGVEQYREHQAAIRLVLLDLTMPKLNGRETLTRILEINPDAQVMIMSGFAESEGQESLEVPGLLGFLPKPIQFADLIAVLERFQNP